MSEEQLKAFMEAVKADSGLKEKLKEAADPDAVVAIAKAAGFAISAEDLKSSRSQAEISEEQLDAVAGGACISATIGDYLSGGLERCWAWDRRISFILINFAIKSPSLSSQRLWP